MIRAMNMTAAGAYLRGRRLALGLSPAEVAVKMKSVLGRNVDPSTLWKIENATMNAGSDLLLAFLEVVQGSAARLMALAQTDASAVEAERIGREVVQAMSEDVAALLQQLPGEEREEWRRRLAARLEELR